MTVRPLGRPPRAAKSRPVTVYLPLARFERLQICAGAAGKPVTSVAAAILDEWLDRNQASIDRLLESARAVQQHLPKGGR